MDESKSQNSKKELYGCLGLIGAAFITGVFGVIIALPTLIPLFRPSPIPATPVVIVVTPTQEAQPTQLSLLPEPTATVQQLVILPTAPTLNPLLNTKDCSGNYIKSFWYASDQEIRHLYGEPQGEHEWMGSEDKFANTPEVALIFGPYINIPSGNYEVVFKMKARDDLQSDNTVIARLNIGTNINPDVANKKIAFSELNTTEYQNFTVPFRAQTCMENLEFRVFYQYKATLFVDSIQLVAK